MAVLASGYLSADEAVALVDALRRSPLYCPDRRSYLLYPDQEVAGFLDRNRLADGALDRPHLCWAGSCPREIDVWWFGDRTACCVSPAGWPTPRTCERALDSLAGEARWSEAVTAEQRACDRGVV